jgi:hypothetical protein
VLGFRNDAVLDLQAHGEQRRDHFLPGATLDHRHDADGTVVGIGHVDPESSDSRG